MKLTTYKFSTVIAKRYWIILVILFVTLSVSGLYAYKVLTPQYETITESESVTLYEYKAWYEHNAVVEQGNPLWPVGWTHSNQPVYFSTICPNLNVSFNFKINGSSTDISAHYHTKLVLSSSSKNTTYWRKEKTISSGITNLNGGDALHDYFNLNISEIENEIGAIQDSLDYYGGDTNVEVITTVRCTGTVGGERIDDQKDFSLPMEISDATYEATSKNYEETIKKDVVSTVNVLQTPSRGDKITSVSPLFTVFLLIVVFTLVKLKYKPLDESAVQELIREKEYGKFKDMISNGKLSLDMEKRDMLRVEVKSLEDLANIAIDTDERVIYDEVASLYFIIHANILYLYRRSIL